MGRPTGRAIAVILLPLAFAACGSQPKTPANLDTLDAQLTAGAAPTPANDPALTSALHDQIMVDPQLAQHANTDAIRPPTEPASGAVPPDDIAAKAMPAPKDEALVAAPAPVRPGHCPQCVAAQQSLTLGALAEVQGGKTGACTKAVRYSTAWATKLPGGVPLYPDARVTEAAGADGHGCSLRVVSFSSAAPLQRLLDWYYTRAHAAGYAVQHQADGTEHVLGGSKSAGAGVFLLTAHAQGDGSSADLMTDGGF